MKASKLIIWILAILVLAAVAIQFVPVERTNPPAPAPLAADPEVLAVLRESCYDCHSNETRWPWYAYVAPASWLVAGDVNEAREHMNFSEWGRLPADELEHLGEEIIEEVEEGAMPLPNYLRLHHEARLTETDFSVLERWAESLPSTANRRESHEGDDEDHELDGEDHADGDDDHEGHDH